MKDVNTFAKAAAAREETEETECATKNDHDLYKITTEDSGSKDQSYDQMTPDV